MKDMMIMLVLCVALVSALGFGARKHAQDAYRVHSHGSVSHAHE